MTDQFFDTAFGGSGLLPFSLLPEALGELAAKIGATSNLLITFRLGRFELDRDTDPGISMTLYQAAREQFSNIMKHAAATKAALKLDISRSLVTLEISDNGNGFDMHTVRKNRGLLTILGRVEQYHGTLELKSKPGKGCLLKVSIPVVST